MTGTPLEALPRRTASARSYVRRRRCCGQSLHVASIWKPDQTIRLCTISLYPGLPAPRGRSRNSWLWLTLDDGRVTGGRDSDPRSNFRLQRQALCAAADPARSLRRVRRTGLEIQAVSVSGGRPHFRCRRRTTRHKPTPGMMPKAVGGEARGEARLRDAVGEGRWITRGVDQ
jgi:hypothetical protein